MQERIGLLTLGLVVLTASAAAAQTKPAASTAPATPTAASLANELAKSNDWLMKAKRLYVRYDLEGLPPNRLPPYRAPASLPGPIRRRDWSWRLTTRAIFT